MAAGVGKTYRMLQEGRQAQAEGRDVVIGYLEPHDRPETSALAEGLEVVPRLARRARRRSSWRRWTSDAVIRRAPELALIDELAHTNAPGMRNEKRYQDIDEVLDAGIDVDLDRQRPASGEPQRRDLRADRDARPRDVPRPDPRRGGRGRARRPDSRGAAGAAARRQGLPPERARRSRSTTSSARERLSALRELALRQVAEDVEKRRGARTLEPLSQQAVARARARARRAAAEVAADHAPRLALGPAARLARWTRSGCASPGRAADRGGGDAARRAPAARRHPRRALPRGGGRRPRRHRPARRGRARLHLRLRRHARRVAPPRDLRRVAALADGPRAAGHRHPRRRQPRGAGQARRR